MIEFPVIDAADQQFGAMLNGRRVTLRLIYSVTTDRWSLDVSIDDLPVLLGLRIVLGVDILQGFGLNIGKLFALATEAGGEPDRASLPAGLVRLYHVTDEEFEAGLDATVSP